MELYVDEPVGVPMSIESDQFLNTIKELHTKMDRYNRDQNERLDKYLSEINGSIRGVIADSAGMKADIEHLKHERDKAQNLRRTVIGACITAAVAIIIAGVTGLYTVMGA